MLKTKNLDYTFKVVFHLICLCIVIALMAHCIFDYLKDEDFTTVQYNKFGNDAKDIYPSFTYCFIWPILYGNIWNKFGNEDTDVARTRDDYINYLLGEEIEDGKFADADYDQLSKKLEKFLTTIEAGLVSGGVVQWTFKDGKLQLNKAFRIFKDDNFGKVKRNFSSEEMKGIPIPKFYISHRGIQEKCYTFDIPLFRNEQINQFRLYIKPEILPGFNGKLNKTIKPIVHQAEKHFSVAFHYPHQKLKSMSFRNG